MTRAILILLLAFTIAAPAFAQAQTCRGEAALSGDQSRFVDWAFAARAPYDNVFRPEGTHQDTVFRALFLGADPWRVLEPGYLTQYLAYSRVPRFPLVHLAPAGLGELRAGIRALRRQTSPKHAALNFFVLIEDKTARVNGLPSDWVRAVIRQEAGQRGPDVDGFRLGAGCRIDRERAGHEIRRTLVRVPESAPRRAQAACIMTAVHLHYGLSDAQAMFRAPGLVAGPQGGRYRAEVDTLPLRPLYGQESPALPRGIGRCEAVCRLGSGEGPCA